MCGAGCNTLNQVSGNGWNGGDPVAYGVPCEEGWELDPSGDRVLFDSASPCFPGDGAEVFLAYTVDEGLCDPK